MVYCLRVYLVVYVVFIIRRRRRRRRRRRLPRLRTLRRRRSSSSSSSSYGCRAPAEGDRAAPTTPDSPRGFLPWKVPVFIFKSLLVPRALLVDFRLRVQTPARSFVFPQRPGAGDEEDAETHRARFAFASWIPPVVVVAVLAVIAVVTVTTSAHAAVVAAVPEFSLLLRFHPERRRTGAATFVGRGTAAAVVVIIMRRRNEKRRSVKRSSKEREKKTVVVVLSLSHEQTNKQMDASSSRALQGITKRFWGKRTHFVSQPLSPRRSHRRRRRNRIAPLGKPEPFRCVVVRAALSSFLRHRFYRHRLSSSSCWSFVGVSSTAFWPVVSLRQRLTFVVVTTRRKHHLSSLSLLSLSLSVSVCICDFSRKTRFSLSFRKHVTLPVTLLFLFEVFSNCF